MIQPLWKMVWRFLKKLKIELPCDPAIQLLVIYLKEINHYLEEMSVLYAVSFTIAKLWKPPKCLLTYDWIKKML